jgi:hypothetical protein
MSLGVRPARFVPTQKQLSGVKRVSFAATARFRLGARGEHCVFEHEYCRMRASNSAGVGWRLWPFTIGPGSNLCPQTSETAVRLSAAAGLGGKRATTPNNPAASASAKVITDGRTMNNLLGPRIGRGTSDHACIFGCGCSAFLKINRPCGTIFPRQHKIFARASGADMVRVRRPRRACDKIQARQLRAPKKLKVALVTAEAN